MASNEQRLLMEVWERETGFAFLYKDEARATDPQGFVILWDRNVQWMRDWIGAMDATPNDYRKGDLRDPDPK